MTDTRRGPRLMRPGRRSWDRRRGPSSPHVSTPVARRGRARRPAEYLKLDDQPRSPLRPSSPPATSLTTARRPGRGPRAPTRSTTARPGRGLRARPSRRHLELSDQRAAIARRCRHGRARRWRPDRRPARRDRRRGRARRYRASAGRAMPASCSTPAIAAPAMFASPSSTWSTPRRWRQVTSRRARTSAR